MIKFDDVVVADLLAQGIKLVGELKELAFGSEMCPKMPTSLKTC